MDRPSSIRFRGAWLARFAPLLRKGQLGMFAPHARQVARHTPAAPPPPAAGHRRAGMVLKPSKSNPRVKRWQKVGADDAPHEALGHPHARHLIGELHGNRGKPVHLTESRASKPEIRALVDSGMIRLQANPQHYFYEHAAYLTPAGRAHYKALLAREDAAGRAAQAGMFKGRSWRVMVSLRLAEQLGLFQARPQEKMTEQTTTTEQTMRPKRNPSLFDAGMIDARVKQHRRRTKSGKVAIVEEHRRRKKPAAPKPPPEPKGKHGTGEEEATPQTLMLRAILRRLKNHPDVVGGGVGGTGGKNRANMVALDMKDGSKIVAGIGADAEGEGVWYSYTPPGAGAMESQHVAVGRLTDRVSIRNRLIRIVRSPPAPRSPKLQPYEEPLKIWRRHLKTGGGRGGFQPTEGAVRFLGRLFEGDGRTEQADRAKMMKEWIKAGYVSEHRDARGGRSGTWIYRVTDKGIKLAASVHRDMQRRSYPGGPTGDMVTQADSPRVPDYPALGAQIQTTRGGGNIEAITAEVRSLHESTNKAPEPGENRYYSAPLSMTRAWLSAIKTVQRRLDFPDSTAEAIAREVTGHDSITAAEKHADAEAQAELQRRLEARAAKRQAEDAAIAPIGADVYDHMDDHRVRQRVGSTGVLLSSKVEGMGHDFGRLVAQLYGTWPPNADALAADSRWWGPVASDGWRPEYPDPSHRILEGSREKGVFWINQNAHGSASLAKLSGKEIRVMALSPIDSVTIGRANRYRPGGDLYEAMTPEQQASAPDVHGMLSEAAESFRQVLKQEQAKNPDTFTRERVVSLYEQTTREALENVHAALDLLDEQHGQDSSKVEITNSNKYSLDSGYELRVGPSGKKRWHKIGRADDDAPIVKIEKKPAPEPDPDPVPSEKRAGYVHTFDVDARGTLELEADEAVARGGAEGDVDLVGQAPDLHHLDREKFQGTKHGRDDLWTDLGLDEVFAGRNGSYWMHEFVHDQIGRDFRDLSERQRKYQTIAQRSFESIWHGLSLEQREKIYSEYFKPHLGGAATWPALPNQQNDQIEIPAGMEKMKAAGWSFHNYQAKALNWFLSDDVKNSEGNRRGSFYMEMGLGKTLAAVGAHYHLKARGEVERSLIVAPISTHASWFEHYGDLSDARVGFATGSKKQRLKTIEAWKNGDLDVLVMTPESLATKGRPKTKETMADVVIEAMKEGPGGAEKVLRVSDETHKFKNPNTGRTQEWHKIRDLDGPMIGMTGTPMPNKSEDLYWIAAAIDPDAFGGDEEAYINTYCVSYYDEKFRERKVVGYDRQNQDALREEVSRLAFVRTLKHDDIQWSIPDMNTISPSIPMDPKAQRMARWAIFYTQWEYEIQSEKRRIIRAQERGERMWEDPEEFEADEHKRMEEHAAGWGKKREPMAELGRLARTSHPDPLIHLLKQIAIAPEVALRNRGMSERDLDRDAYKRAGPEPMANTDEYRAWQKRVSDERRQLREERKRRGQMKLWKHGESPKMKFCLDKAQEHLEANPGKGVVVMGEYHGALDLAHDGLVKRGLRPEDIARIDGTTSPKKRIEIQRDFNAGKYRALLAGTAAVETGANLQRNCSFLAHLTTPYNPTLLSQSTGRVWRQGQKHITTVVRPVGSAVEATIENLLGRKLSESAVALGGLGKGEEMIAQSLLAKRDHSGGHLGKLYGDAEGYDEKLATAIEDTGQVAGKKRHQGLLDLFGVNPPSYKDGDFFDGGLVR